jgi:hypothetical protein
MMVYCSRFSGSRTRSSSREPGWRRKIRSCASRWCTGSRRQRPRADDARDHQTACGRAGDLYSIPNFTCRPQSRPSTRKAGQDPESADCARQAPIVMLCSDRKSSPLEWNRERTRGSTAHCESVSNLLIANGPDFAGCFRMIVEMKGRIGGFVSAIPRFESWRPSQPVRSLHREFRVWENRRHFQARSSKISVNSNQSGKHEIGKIGNNAVTTEVRTARSLA